MTRMTITLSAIVFMFHAPIRADVLTQFNGTTPFQAVDTNLSGNTILGNPVGPFTFSVVSSTDSRFSGSFSSFCADLSQDVKTGNQYNYQITNVSSLPTINGNANKVALIQELYDKFYSVATDGEKGGAFQLSQWEIIYDGGSGSAGLNLDNGNFKTLPGQSETSISVAKNWLSQLGTPASTPDYQLVGLLSDTAQNQIIGFKNNEPNPVPAPPAAILSLFAIVVLVAKRSSIL